MIKFEEVEKRFCNLSFEIEPVAATFAGADGYNDKVASFDEEKRRDQIISIRDLLTDIGLLPSDPSTGVDVDYMKGKIEATLAREEALHPLQVNPIAPIESAIFAIYATQLRNVHKSEPEALRLRLSKIPEMLKEGMISLKSEKIPSLWVDSALEVTGAAKGFFSGLKEWAEKESTENAQFIEKETPAILKAIDGYESFLKKDVATMAKGDFSIGSDLFNFLLKRGEFLSYGHEKLIELGKEHISLTKKRLEETAKEIDKNKSWQEITLTLKKSHPDEVSLLSTYKKEMARAREFVKEKDLVDFPPSEQLDVIETPEFQKPFTPYAAYIQPPAFKPSEPGFFWVTLPPSSADSKVKESMLQDHMNAGIPITALHEAYPGHHLQLSIAAHLKSMVRRLADSTVFAEGWALYCEDMMYEEGFYKSPETRLIAGKDLLWRSCRVLIDASLHSGQMSFDKAVHLLTDTAKLEPENAKAEVTRYTLSPTQPMSYLVGKLQIVEMRDLWRKKMGNNLKSFHNTLLSSGTLPVPLVRREMESFINRHGKVN